VLIPVYSYVLADTTAPPPMAVIIITLYRDIIN
jgi:hypothetical protein